MNKKYIIGFLALAFLISCVPEIDQFDSSAGTVDFTTYVALGNSLTAGYADNALYRSGQLNSFPNMLAEQFAKVGMQGGFTQPLMPDDDGVGLTGTTMTTKLILAPSLDCNNVPGLSPTLSNPTATQAALGIALNTPIANQGPFNNFGVPGAKAAHLLAPGYGDPAGILAGTANPYYARFASSTTTNIVDQADALNPTFFTLWIGNNDVLGYATSGGVGDVITPTAAFTTYINLIAGAMAEGGVKGAIANIPNVTDIPFFRTINYNDLVLSDQNDVDALNAAYNGTGISFTLGRNAFVIADASVPVLGFRQMQAGELVLLSTPQDNLKCAGWGSQIPIPDQFILTADEIAQINAAIAGYNGAIADAATANDLALVNMNAHLNALQTGLMYDGVGIDATFVTGGAFSLDGVHLTPRGYAVVANFFIDAINSEYNANVPKLNIADYEGVLIP